MCEDSRGNFTTAVWVSMQAVAYKFTESYKGRSVSDGWGIVSADPVADYLLIRYQRPRLRQ